MTQPVYLSVTDMQDFQRCRRSWDFQSVNRQGKRHKVNKVRALGIGSAVHKGIEGLYATGLTSKAIEAAGEYFDVAHDERVAEYTERHGYAPSQDEFVDFWEDASLALGMVKQYAENYGSQPLDSEGLKHVASEVTFKIYLGIFNSREVFFVGTWDDIAVHEETGTPYLVERKTYSQPVDSKDLQHLNQFVSYAWAFEVVTGQKLQGILYDGLAKRLISMPKLRKDGSLSTDKRAAVTLQGFLDALQGHNLDIFDAKHGARYQEYIQFLEERETYDDHRFFYREMVTVTSEQKEAFGKRLFMLADEMTRENLNILPSFTFDGCRGCRIKDICYTIEKGYDPANILESRYETKTYGTMETVRAMEPNEIDSFDHMLNILEGD